MNTLNHKFVVAVNKTLEPGVAMNAVAHMALGLMAQADEIQKQEMKFMPFVDGSGVEHPSISGLSLIVLRATNGELRKLCNEAREQGILYTDFIQTMTGDTYIEQLEKTKATTAENIVYYGVAVWGEKVKIDPLTKKMSLWR